MRINNFLIGNSAERRLKNNYSENKFREQLEIKQNATKLNDRVDLNTTHTQQSADYKELTQEQIDILKEKYDVKNMSYEEMGALLNELSEMGAVSKTFKNDGFLMIPVEIPGNLKEMINEGNNKSVKLIEISKDDYENKMASSTNKLLYFEILSKQLQGKTGRSGELLEMHQRVTNVFKQLIRE